MASSNEPFLVIDDLSGGLNLVDPLLKVPPTQVVECTDVEWYQSLMPRPRRGATNVTTGAFAPSGTYRALFRFTPQGSAGESDTALFVLTSDPSMAKLTSGPTWTSVSISDTLSYPDDAQATSYSNRLFWAYHSNVDRLHVYDNATSTLRRTSMDTPSAPTAANTGSGSYTATLRYYKVSFVEIQGSTIRRRSELSSALSFTPSGSGTAARVTKPASISEGETHWELWGSANGTNYYKLASTAVGTTTYDDSAAPSSYSNNELAPDTGVNTVLPSAYYLLALDNRLFLARSWVWTAYDSRVWWTPRANTTGVGDEERLDTTTGYYVDVAPGVHGPIRGLGQLFGDPIVFKSTAMYKLLATGDVNNPYNPVLISDQVGLLHQRSVCNGFDENGSPCLYWLSARGPMRYGVQGLQYLGRDIEPLWDNWFTSTTTQRPCHAVSYQERNQIWFWFGAASDTYPSILLVFHTLYGRSQGGAVRGGWSRYSNLEARCSVMFAQTVDASGSTTAMKPYLGRPSTTALWKADSGTSNDPSGTYTAAFWTVPYGPAGPMTNSGVTEMELVADAISNRTITVDVYGDYGKQLRSFSVSLTAGSDETVSVRLSSEVTVHRYFEDARFSQAKRLIFKVYDGNGSTSTIWRVHALNVRVRPEQTAP